MRAAALTLILVLAGARVSCQERAADVASTVGVVTSLGAAVYQAAKSEHPRRAFGCLALRESLANGAAVAVKAFVRERRPDGSDRKSFYSQHTTIAAAAVSSPGWNIAFTLPIATGRVVAKKHYAWDTAAGAGAGFLTHAVCR